MSLLDINGILSDILKEKGVDAFAKTVSDAIEESNFSRSQSFTIHKKVADKLIAYSKINITRDK